MSWTQPACEACWQFREPDREPVRLRDPALERCCNCGVETRSGIYVRVDPATIRFPQTEEDDR